MTVTTPDTQQPSPSSRRPAGSLVDRPAEVFVDGGVALTGAAATSTAGWFESVYLRSRDRAEIPWDRVGPHPALVTWLNVVAPSLVRCGARVAVVGCGLGDDAREIIRRGYDVTAFDWSVSAIEWACRLDPGHAASFVCADLLDPPARWHGRFDLVVDVNTVQSVDPSMRIAMMRGWSRIAATRGRILAIGRIRADAASGEDEDRAAAGTGPPWPLTPEELSTAASTAGLHLEGVPDVFDLEDGDGSAVRHFRALLGRSGAAA